MMVTAQGLVMATPTSTPRSGVMTSVNSGRDDSKPPDISRKVTACVSCRKQKIKCLMPQDQPPCVRCKKRGLSCTVNRSLQMLLEDHATWKSAMMHKMQRFESALSKVGDRLSMPELQDLSTMTTATASTSMAIDETPDSTVHDADLPDDHDHDKEQAWKVVMDPGCGPASIPASCVSEVHKTASPGPDGQYTRRTGMG